MEFSIPAPVEAVLSALRAAGYEACPVGGCVRDTLLGRTPQDWDVATSALPEETIRVLAAFRCLETGRKHGTVTACSGEMPIEVTTYRVDGPYADHRRPESVRFTGSLTEDLRRRDFTINAMALACNGVLTDPFGGQTDLQKGLIRCVGDPGERFREDGLRILRALRFASCLGFAVEEETARAIHREKALLSAIAMERISAELLKFLCGPRAAELLEEYHDVFFQIIPELAAERGCTQQNPHHIYDVWGHTLKALEAVPPAPDRRLAMLLHDIGKPLCRTVDEMGVGHFHGHGAAGGDLAETVAHRLRLPGEFARLVTEGVRYHDLPFTGEERLIRRRLQRLGEPLFFLILDLKRGDTAGQNPDLLYRLRELDEIETKARAMLSENACLTLKQLAVTGKDLMEWGERPGPELGRALDFLLDAVVDEACGNTREALFTHYLDWNKQGRKASDAMRRS